MNKFIVLIAASFFTISAAKARSVEDLMEYENAAGSYQADLKARSIIARMGNEKRMEAAKAWGLDLFSKGLPAGTVLTTARSNTNIKISAGDVPVIEFFLPENDFGNNEVFTENISAQGNGRGDWRIFTFKDELCTFHPALSRKVKFNCR